MTVSQKPRESLWLCFTVRMDGSLLESFQNCLCVQCHTKGALASLGCFQLGFFYYKTELYDLKHKQGRHIFIDVKFLKEHLGLGGILLYVE